MSNRETRRAAQSDARRTGANAKGEALLDLGFRKFKIKVTLGAMARAEDEFGCDFADIEQHLGSTKNIAAFIAILARSAGEDVSDEDIKQIRYCDLEVSELMARISAATGAADQGNAQAPKPN